MAKAADIRYALLLRAKDGALCLLMDNAPSRCCGRRRTPPINAKERTRKRRARANTPSYVAATRRRRRLPRHASGKRARRQIYARRAHRSPLNAAVSKYKRLAVYIHLQQHTRNATHGKMLKARRRRTATRRVAWHTMSGRSAEARPAASIYRLWRHYDVASCRRCAPRRRRHSAAVASAPRVAVPAYAKISMFGTTRRCFIYLNTLAPFKRHWRR